MNLSKNRPRTPQQPRKASPLSKTRVNSVAYRRTSWMIAWVRNSISRSCLLIANWLTITCPRQSWSTSPTSMTRRTTRATSRPQPSIPQSLLSPKKVVLKYKRNACHHKKLPKRINQTCDSFILEVTNYSNIAKGTTDPKVEFYLPK